MFDIFRIYIDKEKLEGPQEYFLYISNKKNIIYGKGEAIQRNINRFLNLDCFVDFTCASSKKNIIFSAQNLRKLNFLDFAIEQECC